MIGRRNSGPRGKHIVRIGDQKRPGASDTLTHAIEFAEDRRLRCSILVFLESRSFSAAKEIQ